MGSNTDSKEDIQKVFNLFDDDKTGYITLHNLKRVAKELGETMSDAELLEMIERADTDQDGQISIDEFPFHYDQKDFRLELLFYTFVFIPVENKYFKCCQQILSKLGNKMLFGKTYHC